MKKTMVLMVAAFAAMMPLMANEETAVVTFDANGGTVDCWDEWGNYYTGSEPSMPVTKGTAISSLPYPWYEDDGHFFTGWFDVNGNEFTEDTIVTNDMTVTARWIVDDGSFKMLVSRSTVMGYFGTCPTELTAADWPVGVTAIGNDAFYNASQLELVSIPAGVTNIGYQAFAYCYSLTNATIPASVEAIGNSAFNGAALTSVVIPSTVTAIGDYAFAWCSDLSSVTFNGDVSQMDISDFAFKGTPWEAAQPFEMIVEGDVVTGYHGTCPASLAVADWPVGVTEIGADAFCGSSLETVHVPACVTNIGNHAFAYCNNLGSVTFGNGREGVAIDPGAFDATPWGEANMPMVLIRWDEYGSETENGTTLGGYHGASPVTLDVPADVTAIGGWTFNGCNTLQELTVPTNVTEIGDYAFASCYNLARAFLPKALEGVIDESSVFDGSPVVVYYYEGDASMLVTITLNANGGSMDATTVHAVPNNVIGILPEPTLNGYEFLGWFTAAEGGNEVMAETVVTGDMTLYAHWEEIVYTYNYIDNGDGTVTLSPYDENWNWIGSCISPVPVGDFILPNEIDGKQVVAIGGDAFDYCNSMTSVVIPASVTNISSEAFSDAFNLTNIAVAADNSAYKSVDGILYTKDGKMLVTCPRSKGGDIVVADGTEKVGTRAFYGNSFIESVTLPAGLKQICEGAFDYCQNASLTSVTIPMSVENIGAYAFGYCSNLATVTFVGAEGDVDVAGTAFAGTPYDAGKPFGLIVDEYGTLVGIHGTAPENLVLADHLNGQHLTCIGNNAFSAGSYTTASVTNIVIPDGVTWIYDCAFNGCAALASVTLPTSLQSIGYGVFGYCTSLRTVLIPSGVTYIGNAFYGCTNLTVHAPETLRDTFSVPEEDGCQIEYYEVLQYTVTFDANGGTIWTGEEYVETMDVEVLEGRTVVDSITTPTRDGFDFAGWFDGDGKRVASGFVVTGDVTLTAYWLEASPWDWYDNGDGVVICGARDDSVVTNGVLTIPATLTVLDDDGEPVPVPVVGIDSYAFNHGSFLVLELPSSVEWIGSGAFSYCRSLTNVTFSGNLDEIDMGDGVHTVFYATPWLNAHPFTFVTAEENGEVYLTGCYGSPVPTETLKLSNDVTVVRAYALTEPEWPGEGYYQFLGWYTASVGGERVGGGEEVAVTGGPVLYARWEAVTPEWYFDITEEDEAIITGNSVSLKGDIVIPASITVEEDDGDGHVTEVTYPVTAIGEDAFYNMGGIESVTIPSSVTRIYDWAFEDCSSLTNVVFVGGMASVQMSVTSAFSGTPWLEAYLATLPAPDNDDFANATMISGASGSVTGTNLGASVEEDEPLSLEPDFESTATVWWRWTAPTNGTFAFSTRGSNFDTVLGVYTGSAVDELEEVASNDDSFGSTSAVTFDAVMGTTYYFAVGGYEEAAGSIILSWGVDDVIVDAGGGKTVAVPGSWLEEYDALWDDYDGDKAAYANSTAVNGRKVWECYVLGLDPEENDDFTIVSFPMNADGTPDLENIEFYPPQDDWNVPAQPVVKGAAALDGEWQTVTEQNKSSLRFFKVVVELP